VTSRQSYWLASISEIRIALPARDQQCSGAASTVLVRVPPPRPIRPGPGN
jgi:hypothetical protein